jgi:hypothetical protein
MDEIFCANYMLFDDIVRETTYAAWIGGDSWEIDHPARTRSGRSRAVRVPDRRDRLPARRPGRRSRRGRAVRLQRRDDLAPSTFPVRTRPLNIQPRNPYRHTRAGSHPGRPAVRARAAPPRPSALGLLACARHIVCPGRAAHGYVCRYCCRRPGGCNAIAPLDAAPYDMATTSSGHAARVAARHTSPPT